jgi:UDP-N-acetylmuramoyl-tripeptide--D-alanyl-D-alanine ligase
MIWTGKQLSEAILVQVNYDLQFGKIEFNSMDVKQGDLFIALKGQIRDGHEFVHEAIKNGASAAIVSQVVASVPREKLIVVDDCLIALDRLAKYKRKSSKAKFIGVTGSVGKTSTKELLKLMLSSQGQTFASRGTFNNQLGVSLNLASMPDDAQYAVIEMGMNAPGEIASLAKMVLPDIAVITSVSDGHIEFFDSREKIADAKCEIFEGLKKEGVVVLNGDISTYERCLDKLKKHPTLDLITFGKDGNYDVKFASYEIMSDQMVRLQYIIKDQEIEIIMPEISMHLASNFAAGFSVIKALKLDFDKAAIAVSKFKPLAGRGQIVEVKNNNRNNTFICDYYNSNPESLKAALTNLAISDHQNKVAIIGDMLELGVQSEELHKSIVPFLVDSGVKKIFLVGRYVKYIAQLLPDTIKSFCYDDVDLLIMDINNHIESEELILIKGSKSIKLFKVALYLGVKDAV